MEAQRYGTVAYESYVYNNHETTYLSTGTYYK